MSSCLKSRPFPVKELRTPCFVVLEDVIRENCLRMQEKAKKYGVFLRPHVKTHKTIEGGLLQTRHSPECRKVVVSTLSEAKFFSENGFHDILYAVPMDIHKLPEIQDLQRKCTIHILIDSSIVFSEVEQFSEKNGIVISCFLKVDAGYHRAGVNPLSNSGLQLAKSIASSSFTKLSGIYSHSGNSYSVVPSDVKAIREISADECRVISKFAEDLRKSGIEVPVVAVGATPTCVLGENFEGVTEIHPGNYAFFDRYQMNLGACSQNQIAVRVASRVLSHYPERNEVLIDAGALALSKDTCQTGGFGIIEGFPDLILGRISQEEGVISSKKDIPFDKLPIGSMLMIIPNHSCLTAACHSEFTVVTNGEVIDIWNPC
eukprot:892822_1